MRTSFLYNPSCAALLITITGCGGLVERDDVSLDGQPPSSEQPGEGGPGDGGAGLPPPSSLPLIPAIDGQLIKAPGTAAPIFRLHGGWKYPFVSALAVASYGYSRAQVHTVDKALIDAIPEAPTLGHREGTLSRVPGKPKVYVLDQEGTPPNATWRRRWIISRAVLFQCQNSFANVVVDPALESAPYVDGQEVSECTDTTLPDGTLVRSNAGGPVYLLSFGDGLVRSVKDLIPDDAVLDSHGYSAARVMEIPQASLDAYPAGTTLSLREGSLMRKVGAPEVYAVQQEGFSPVRRRVPDACNLERYGLVKQKVYDLNAADFDTYAEGPPLRNFCPQE
ncbi:MAG TPA: hypothetical protein VEY30_12870 [Myxococcaceae bacterium]|nr:hypothetical protein [Myxococcaceae bacterium]